MVFKCVVFDDFLRGVTYRLTDSSHVHMDQSQKDTVTKGETAWYRNSICIIIQIATVFFMIDYEDNIYFLIKARFLNVHWFTDHDVFLSFFFRVHHTRNTGAQ